MVRYSSRSHPNTFSLLAPFLRTLRISAASTSHPSRPALLCLLVISRVFECLCRTDGSSVSLGETCEAAAHFRLLVRLFSGFLCLSACWKVASVSSVSCVACYCWSAGACFRLACPLQKQKQRRFLGGVDRFMLLTACHPSTPTMKRSLVCIGGSALPPNALHLFSNERPHPCFCTSVTH